MRIGIDARELLGHSTGVGRYLAQLCQAWALESAAAPHRFVLYVPESWPSSFPAFPFLEVGERFEVVSVAGGSGTRWEQFSLPPVANTDRLDVFFSPAYSTPLKLRPPSVVTIPDVSFAARPEWFTWREGLRRRWLVARSVQRAARVVTISEFSRREIEHFFGVGADRILVTPLAADARWAATASPARRQPLVLFVGSVFTRRHLPQLFRAFRRVLRRIPEARLAVVGANRTFPRENLRGLAEEQGLASHVSIEDWIDDERLVAYYQRAGAFAFLSEYEGFGLPPLDALAAGIPIVVLDTPVAHEVYGDAAAYVALDDLPGIADALCAALDDAPRDLGGAAARVVASYSWSRTADLTLAALEQAARAGRP